MKLLLLSTKWDTAGQQAAIRSALLRYRPEWQVDQMARLEKSYGYPRHMAFERHELHHLWSQADVIHLNLTLHPSQHPLFAQYQKPIVVHHHGSEYRGRRDLFDAAERMAGALSVVSTLDLLGSPGVEWLPNVADLDALAGHRVMQSGPLRVAHSPTDRGLKGTDAIVAAVGRYDLDLIEGVAWAECLARKGRADIFVDQLFLGYGLSAIEAWAMGIPVIAGVADPVTRQRMLDTFGDLPFVEATPETLADRLAELEDPRLRREWGERGRAHVERFHSQRAVVERLEPIYERAVGMRAAA